MSWVVPFQHMKYESAMVTFTEVPDEISLCINVTGCPCKCKNCFEPWLAEDTGTELNYAELQRLIEENPHITCVCFMGGDRWYDDLSILIMEMRREFPNLKWAFYSGRQEMHPFLPQVLDYYKVGPYLEERGPLNKKTTNQIFYKKINDIWVDNTYRFQQEKI